MVSTMIAIVAHCMRGTLIDARMLMIVDLYAELNIVQHDHL